MKSDLLRIILAVFLVGSSAAIKSEESAVYQWQIKRLMQPGEQVIVREKQRQSVFIYENLKLADIEKALDEHFARMENMMFIGTLLPPTSAGGLPTKEQDGCD